MVILGEVWLPKVLVKNITDPNKIIKNPKVEAEKEDEDWSTNYLCLLVLKLVGFI